MDKPSHKKAWSPTEIKNYCSCGAVAMADRMTEEMWQVYKTTGEYPPEWWAMREEVRQYCGKKYLKRLARDSWTSFR
jgi:hypothetical protein